MDNRKNEIRAFLLTLLVVLITVLLLLFTGMHYEYPPRDMDLVQLKQDSIMFGGEYVMLGNTPQPTESEEMDTENPETAEEVAEQPSVEGDDLKDAGEPAKQAKPLVTAKEPSPMKVKEKPKEEKPKKTGPATTQNEASKQEKVKKGNDAATNNRVKNSFGKSQGSGSGKQGSPEGNSNTGALSGKPGIGGLVGYTLEYWGRPHSRYTGSVKVRVRVNARGQVIEATAISGSGEAWSHGEVRRSCESESLKSAFSVPKNATTEAVGTIIWRFV
jgi:outer membrane biosynthesis protein TonB